MATAATMCMSDDDSLPEVKTSDVVFNSEENRRCRSCYSQNKFFTDWAQGDRICTNCGVVDEGHLLETNPEWREFNDTEDLAKGGPSMARSGLVPVDETRYVGGLQPTSLSTQCFGGGASGPSYQKLVAANRKMDRRMQRMHSQAIATAKITHQLRQKRLQNGEAVETDTDTVSERPDVEEMVWSGLDREEEETKRIRLALYAEKWSLKRAIRLYDKTASSDVDPETEERLDSTLKKASTELYCAYCILLAAARRLNLPDRVTQEATNMLCQYATKKDGLQVRGVASTLRQKEPDEDAGKGFRSESVRSRLLRKSQQKMMEQAARDVLNEYNRVKQMGAICAALLFYTARKLKWPRSLPEVCESVKPTDVTLSNGTPNPYLLDTKRDSFIKKKHCSKAMAEIRESFPDFCQSAASSDGVTTMQPNQAGDYRSPSAIANFAEHTLRKLKLPPVAEASVQYLVFHYWHSLNDDKTDTTATGKKLSVICAAFAYFVCSAGGTMQRLASQSRTSLEVRPQKKRRLSGAVSKSSTPELKPAADIPTETEDLTNVTGFDGSEDFSKEQREYEMRRMWDAWSEQRPWERSIFQVEDCCGVTRKQVSELFQKQLFANRENYLGVLRKAAKNQSGSPLCETPLASILLTHMTAAAPLMKAKVA